jgi:hypothetical protein
MGFGIPLFRDLYASNFMGMSTYAIAAQIALLSAAGLALLAASGQARPGQSHARMRIALAVSILGMILYWLPYVLWSQNIIPERQTATISAVVIAAVMVVVQYAVVRRLMRKPATVQ